jgi:hypothetical protein
MTSPHSIAPLSGQGFELHSRLAEFGIFVPQKKWAGPYKLFFFFYIYIDI